MNEEIAKKRAADLNSAIVSGWKIGDYQGSGKSAFVCKATQNDKIAAIKLFDTSNLSQKEIDELKIRLDRQLQLRGKRHPNLVEIYDGGYDSSNRYFYLVMQFLDSMTLTKVIKKMPYDKIGPLISQIGSATQFLDTLDLCHRDIKPDNIVISNDFSKAVLLDLGVLRPLGKSEITDSTHSLRFVGTLRYSSPEFLFRTGEDTKDGWKAVSFYQIGAVLHDMIMQKPIFEGQTEPFAKLVHAIEHETPPLFREEVDPELIHVARLCLLKQPSLRLRMVDWNSFKFPRIATDKMIAVKNRIQQRKITSQKYTSDEIDVVSKASRDKEQFLFDLKEILDKNIRNICIGNDDYPNLTVSHFNLVGQFDSYINIIFSSSFKHSLCSELSIIITCSIVDFKSHLIQFQCVGFLQPSVSLESAIPFLSLLYEGFIDDNQLQEALGNMLCKMLDKAQSRCDTNSTLPKDSPEINPWIIYKFDDEQDKNE